MDGEGDAGGGADWLDRIERGELTANGAAKAADTMKSATPSKSHGGDRKSEKVDQGDNITLKSGRGTDPSYLAARIKRDHPEIAARVEAGEFKSIRAAAIEAGIVKVATPIEKARKAISALPHEDVAVLIDEMMIRVKTNQRL